MDVFSAPGVHMVRSMPRDAEGWLYFIGPCSGGPIKIGVAKDPQKRLRELQVSHPEQLRIYLASPGAAHMEQDVHRLLSHARVRGEWFEREAVLSFLDSVVEAMPA